MTTKVSIKPKIMELQSTNEIYMTMNIAILSNDVNYNSARFTDDFINGVVENKERYIGIPFLASREKLEDGEYDNLSHELNLDSGKLETDQIGSFVDFWKEEIDGATCLMGQIRIFKRFPEVCSAIKELYADDVLETSCEVLVSSYADMSDDGIRSIHYNDGDNALIGSAVVTTGAERRAKPTMLVAEAYKKDMISIQKGEKELPKTKDKVEVANKGVKVKYSGSLETSSLTFYQIEEKVYNLLNPVDIENGGRDYNYFIYEIFNDKIIVGEWDTGDLIEAKYSVDGEDLMLNPKEDWVIGAMQFVPNYINIDSIRKDNEVQATELAALKEELEKIKGEKETMSKQLEEKDLELNEDIEQVKVDLDKANELVVSEQEAKQKLEEQIAELSEQIEDLKVYKENFEKAEQEKKQAELSEKYAKLFDEETFQSEEIQAAIEACDVTTLNSKVVEVMAAKRLEETDEEPAVEIAATASKQYVPSVKDRNYWASAQK